MKKGSKHTISFGRVPYDYPEEFMRVPYRRPEPIMIMNFSGKPVPEELINHIRAQGGEIGIRLPETAHIAGLAKESPYDEQFLAVLEHEQLHQALAKMKNENAWFYLDNPTPKAYSHSRATEKALKEYHPKNVKR